MMRLEMATKHDILIDIGVHASRLRIGVRSWLFAAA